MDVQAIDQALSPVSASPVPTVGLPAFPAPSGTNGSSAPADQTLHRALSQLVGGGSHVSVQFKVVSPGEVVTVFKNSDTGEVITQFPAESMVLIAQFFSKLAGAVLDRTA
jgi:hypothetical protein